MLRKNTVKIKGPSGRKWKDISISQDGRYGAPGENRQLRIKPTPEQIARQNHLNKVRRIWQLIRGNYQEGDRWVTVTYRKGERPDWETAVRQLANFRKRVTYWFRRRDIPVRMMYSIEHGSKGGIHMHMLLNDVEGVNIDRILQRLWAFGQIHTSGLYDSGDYHDLAEYLAKGEKYGHSQNMKMPEPEKPRLLTRADLMEYPKPEKGWRILEGSIIEGINPVTGSPYLRYSMVQEPPPDRKKKRKGRNANAGKISNNRKTIPEAGKSPPG